MPSMKECPVCETAFKDGDKVAAVVLASFVAIPSTVNVAISQPTRCVEIVHVECYDFEEEGESDE